MFQIRTSLTIAILVLCKQCLPLCPSIQNCVQCINPHTCTNCRQDYIIRGNICIPGLKKSLQTRNQIRQLQSSKLSSNSENSESKQQDKKVESNERIFWFGSSGSKIPQQQKCIYEWKGLCMICKNGYQIGASGKCLQKLQKCLEYGQNSICSKCNNMFILQNGQCRNVGCQETNYYKCKKCKEGYKLNDYQNCQVQNCSQYQNGKCINCNKQFSLKNGFCFRTNASSQTSINYLDQTNKNLKQDKSKDLSKEYDNTVTSQNNKSASYIKIANCLRESLGKCQICQEGYFISEYKCDKVPPFCLKFDKDARKCTRCESENLILLNNRCIDTQCLQSDSLTKQCLSCGAGYRLNERKFCQLIKKDQNCLQADLNGCLECKQGFYLSNLGSCLKLPENCIDQRCQYCRPGYISIRGKCQPLSNCLKLQNNICKQCEKGFSITNIGSCTKSIQNCIRYSESKCQQCPANFALVDNSCQFNSSFVDPNCRYRNIKSQCQICRDNYRLQPRFQYLCMPRNPYCRNSTKLGVCFGCFDGYVLNQVSGQCILIPAIQNCATQKQGFCQKCADRFYLVTSLVCKQVNPLCKSYNPQSGYCTQCYNGYVLIGRTCILISRFTNMGKQNSAQLLKQRDPLCKSFNKVTGFCQACYQGYQIIGPTCVLQKDNESQTTNIQQITDSNSKNTYIDFCKKFDQQTKECVECIDRFYKVGQTCQQVSPQCKTYNSTSGGCLSCYEGYTLQDKQCNIVKQMVIKNCETKDKQKCIKCLSGYFLNDNSCKPVSIVCGSYNQNTGQCISCIQGYFKNSRNICIKISLGADPHCRNYNDQGYCIECNQKYVLQDFLCM